jgi:nucleotide-binding universal stress UspA family protein
MVFQAGNRTIAATVAQLAIIRPRAWDTHHRPWWHFNPIFGNYCVHDRYSLEVSDSILTRSIAGGPNAKYALELLPALISLSREPKIHLCQFFDPHHPQPDLNHLHTAARFLRRHLDIPTTVTALYSDEIAASAIDFAAHKQCDAIVLGASREELLRQAIHNIPDAIARGSDCTVIVVRKAIAEPDTEGS